MTRRRSAGCSRSSRVVATIGLGLTVGVIAAATLAVAQAPTEARSVLVTSDPSAAAVPAASGRTANADAQPLQNPAADPVNEPAVPFRPNEVYDRVRRLYLPISIEKMLGIHKRGGTTALPTRRRRTVVPNSHQRVGNSCNVASTNTPVSTSQLSLVDAAPNYMPFLNNGPVFGLAGTEEADFWHRTQLIGDPDCKRTDLTRRGVFIDLYSTSAYQHVTSGGLKTGNSYLQNTQLSINLDTGRAGLWPGGLLHLTVQSRYGSSLNSTFTAGSFTPEYTGLDLPGPLFWQDTLPSEYSLIQGVSTKVSVLLGKINGLFIADETLFGERFRYYFANSNFNKNPIYNNFYNTTTLSAVGIWTTTPWLTIAGGLHDPYTQPNTLAANAFQNGNVNLYLEAIFTYKAGSLPAQISPAINWSNAPKIDLESPFGQLSPAQIPQAVNVLVGNDSGAGLPMNFKNRNFFVISNFSQYLFVKEEDPSVIAEKLRTAQPLRGVGVFGRLGYVTPEASNTIDRDASVALLARGLLGSRPYDSFGIGYYYNGISRGLKNSIRQLTDGTTVRNENGIEIFYDFAITPAINVNAGYQHIWNPLVASVIAKQDHADLFLARLNVVW